MTDNDIKGLANASGGDRLLFARLIEAKAKAEEREACAQVCDADAVFAYKDGWDNDEWDICRRNTAKRLGDAIRARSNEK